MSDEFALTPQFLQRHYYETIVRFQNYGHRFKERGIHKNPHLQRAHELIQDPATLTLFDLLTFQGTATVEEYAEQFAHDEGPRALGVLIEIDANLELARQALE